MRPVHYEASAPVEFHNSGEVVCALRISTFAHNWACDFAYCGNTYYICVFFRCNVAKTRVHMDQLRAEILGCHGGDVYLSEYGPYRDAVQLRAVPSKERLPRAHAHPCPFHTNAAFAKAVHAGEAAAIFRTPSGNVLVVPTAPYASIRDFAMRASTHEFAALFALATNTRNKLAKESGQPWYLETIGHHVAHLHLRLVRQK